MDDDAFLDDVERHAGRRLTDDERALAHSLRADKTAAVIARELDAAPVTDPKKIRPEHTDTAREE